MRMDEIGYNHKHDSSFYIDRPNGAGDWLFIIMKTKAVFRIDSKDIHTPASSFIIYTPEYPEYYHADNEEYIDDWIHFGANDEEIKLMHALKIPLNKPVPLSDTTHASDLIKYMCYEQYSPNQYKQECVDLYFRLLIYKVAECMQAYQTAGGITESVYAEKLIWLRESIYRWPAREWNIDDMAAELSLSRSRIQHLYTDTFGVSISKDIITSRLDKAAELLKKTDLSVIKIASDVGYKNVSYFSRQFHTVFKATPLQFRKDYWKSHGNKIKK